MSDERANDVETLMEMVGGDPAGAQVSAAVTGLIEVWDTNNGNWGSDSAGQAVLDKLNEAFRAIDRLGEPERQQAAEQLSALIHTHMDVNFTGNGDKRGEDLSRRAGFMRDLIIAGPLPAYASRVTTSGSDYAYLQAAAPLLTQLGNGDAAVDSLSGLFEEWRNANWRGNMSTSVGQPFLDRLEELARTIDQLDEPQRTRAAQELQTLMQAQFRNDTWYEMDRGEDAIARAGAVADYLIAGGRMADLPASAAVFTEGKAFEPLPVQTAQAAAPAAAEPAAPVADAEPVEAPKPVYRRDPALLDSFSPVTYDADKHQRMENGTLLVDQHYVNYAWLAHEGTEQEKFDHVVANFGITAYLDLPIMDAGRMAGGYLGALGELFGPYSTITVSPQVLESALAQLSAEAGLPPEQAVTPEQLYVLLKSPEGTALPQNVVQAFQLNETTGYALETYRTALDQYFTAAMANDPALAAELNAALPAVPEAPAVTVESQAPAEEAAVEEADIANLEIPVAAAPAAPTLPESGLPVYNLLQQADNTYKSAEAFADMYKAWTDSGGIFSGDSITISEEEGQNIIGRLNQVLRGIGHIEDPALRQQALSGVLDFVERNMTSGAVWGAPANLSYLVHAEMFGGYAAAGGNIDVLDQWKDEGQDNGNGLPVETSQGVILSFLVEAAAERDPVTGQIKDLTLEQLTAHLDDVQNKIHYFAQDNTGVTAGYSVEAIRALFEPTRDEAAIAALVAEANAGTLAADPVAAGRKFAELRQDFLEEYSRIAVPTDRLQVWNLMQGDVERYGIAAPAVEAPQIRYVQSHNPEFPLMESRSYFLPGSFDETKHKIDAGGVITVDQYYVMYEVYNKGFFNDATFGQGRAAAYVVEQYGIGAYLALELSGGTADGGRLSALAELLSMNQSGGMINANEPGEQPLITLEMLESALADMSREAGLPEEEWVTVEQFLGQLDAEPGTALPENFIRAFGMPVNPNDPTQVLNNPFDTYRDTIQNYFALEVTRDQIRASEIQHAMAEPVNLDGYTAAGEAVSGRVTIDGVEYQLVLTTPAGQQTTDGQAKEKAELGVSGVLLYPIGENGQPGPIPVTEMHYSRTRESDAVLPTVQAVVAGLEADGALSALKTEAAFPLADFQPSMEVIRADGLIVGGPVVLKLGEIAYAGKLIGDVNFSAVLRNAQEGVFDSLGVMEQKLEQVASVAHGVNATLLAAGANNVNDLEATRVIYGLIRDPLESAFVERAQELYPELAALGEVDAETLRAQMSDEQIDAVAKANEPLIAAYESVIARLNWEVLDTTGAAPEMDINAVLVMAAEAVTHLSAEEAAVLKTALMPRIAPEQRELIGAMLDLAGNNEAAVAAWKEANGDQIRRDYQELYAEEHGELPSEEVLEAYVAALNPFEQFADQLLAHHVSGGSALPRAAVRELYLSGVLDYLAEGQSAKTVQVLQDTLRVTRVVLEMEDFLYSEITGNQELRAKVAGQLMQEAGGSAIWNQISPEDREARVTEELTRRTDAYFVKEKDAIEELMAGKSLADIDRNFLMTYVYTGLGVAGTEEAMAGIRLIDTIAPGVVTDEAGDLATEIAASVEPDSDLALGESSTDEEGNYVASEEAVKTVGGEFGAFLDAEGVTGYQDMNDELKVYYQGWLLEQMFAGNDPEKSNQLIALQFSLASRSITFVDALKEMGVTATAEEAEALLVENAPDFLEGRTARTITVGKQYSNVVEAATGLNSAEYEAAMIQGQEYHEAGGSRRELIEAALGDAGDRARLISDDIMALVDDDPNNDGQLDELIDILAVSSPNEAALLSLVRDAIIAIPPGPERKAYAEAVIEVLPVLTGAESAAGKEAQLQIVLAGVVPVLNQEHLAALRGMQGVETNAELLAKLTEYLPEGMTLPTGVAPLMADVLDNIETLPQTREKLAEVLKTADFTDLSKVDPKQVIDLAMTYIHDGEPPPPYAVRAERSQLLADVARPVLETITGGFSAITLPPRENTPENQQALLAAAGQLGINYTGPDGQETELGRIFQMPLELTTGERGSLMKEALYEARRAGNEDPSQDDADVLAIYERKVQEKTSDPQALFDSRYERLYSLTLSQQDKYTALGTAATALFTDPVNGIFANLHEMPKEMVTAFVSGDITPTQLLDMYQAYAVEPVNFVNSLRADILELPDIGAEVPTGAALADYDRFVGTQVLDGVYGRELAAQLQGLDAAAQAELLGTTLGLPATGLEELRQKVESGEITLNALVTGLNKMPGVGTPVEEAAVPATDAEGAAEPAAAAAAPLPVLDIASLRENARVEYGLRDSRVVTEAGIRFQYSYAEHLASLDDPDGAEGTGQAPILARLDSYETTMSDADRARYGQPEYQAMRTAIGKVRQGQELTAEDERQLYLYELERRADLEAQGRIQLIRTEVDRLGQTLGGSGYGMIKGLMDLKQQLPEMMEGMSNIPFIGPMIANMMPMFSNMIDSFTSMAIGIGESTGMVPEGTRETLQMVAAINDPNYQDHLEAIGANPYNDDFAERWGNAGGETAAAPSFDMPVVNTPEWITFFDPEAQNIYAIGGTTASPEVMQAATQYLGAQFVSNMTENPVYRELMLHPDASPEMQTAINGLAQYISDPERLQAEAQALKQDYPALQDERFDQMVEAALYNDVGGESALFQRSTPPEGDKPQYWTVQWPEGLTGASLEGDPEALTALLDEAADDVKRDVTALQAGIALEAEAQRGEPAAAEAAEVQEEGAGQQASAAPQTVTFLVQNGDSETRLVLSGPAVGEETVQAAQGVVNAAFLSQMVGSSYYYDLMSNEGMTQQLAGDLDQLALSAADGPDAVRAKADAILSGLPTYQQDLVRDDLQRMVNATIQTVYVPQENGGYAIAVEGLENKDLLNHAALISSGQTLNLAAATQREAILRDAKVGWLDGDDTADAAASGDTGSANSSANSGSATASGDTGGGTASGGGGIATEEAENPAAVTEEALEDAVVVDAPAAAAAPSGGVWLQVAGAAGVLGTAMLVVPGELFGRAMAMDWAIGDLATHGVTLTASQLQAVQEAVRNDPNPDQEPPMTVVIRVLKELDPNPLDEEQRRQLEARRQEMETRYTDSLKQPVTIQADYLPPANEQLRNWAGANSGLMMDDQLRLLQLDEQMAAFARRLEEASRLADENARRNAQAAVVNDIRQSPAGLTLTGLGDTQVVTLVQAAVPPQSVTLAQTAATVDDAYAAYVSGWSRNYLAVNTASPSRTDGDANTNTSGNATATEAAIAQPAAADPNAVAIATLLAMLSGISSGETVEGNALGEALAALGPDEVAKFQAEFAVLAETNPELAAQLATLMQGLAALNPEAAAEMALLIGELSQQDPDLAARLVAELLVTHPELAATAGVALAGTDHLSPESMQAFLELLGAHPELASVLEQLAATSPGTVRDLVTELTWLQQNNPEAAALAAEILQGEGGKSRAATLATMLEEIHLYYGANPTAEQQAQLISGLTYIQNQTQTPAIMDMRRELGLPPTGVAPATVAAPAQTVAPHAFSAALQDYPALNAIIAGAVAQADSQQAEILTASFGEVLTQYPTLSATLERMSSNTAANDIRDIAVGLSWLQQTNPEGARLAVAILQEEYGHNYGRAMTVLLNDARTGERNDLTPEQLNEVLGSMLERAPTGTMGINEMWGRIDAVVAASATPQATETPTVTPEVTPTVTPEVTAAVTPTAVPTVAAGAFGAALQNYPALSAIIAGAVAQADSQQAEILTASFGEVLTQYPTLSATLEQMAPNTAANDIRDIAVGLSWLQQNNPEGARLAVGILQEEYGHNYGRVMSVLLTDIRTGDRSAMTPQQVNTVLGYMLEQAPVRTTGIMEMWDKADQVAAAPTPEAPTPEAPKTETEEDTAAPVQSAAPAAVAVQPETIPDLNTVIGATLTNANALEPGIEDAFKELVELYPDLSNRLAQMAADSPDTVRDLVVELAQMQQSNPQGAGLAARILMAPGGQMLGEEMGELLSGMGKAGTFPYMTQEQVNSRLGDILVAQQDGRQVGINQIRGAFSPFDAELEAIQRDLMDGKEITPERLEAAFALSGHQLTPEQVQNGMTALTALLQQSRETQMTEVYAAFGLLREAVNSLTDASGQTGPATDIVNNVAAGGTVTAADVEKLLPEGAATEQQIQQLVDIFNSGELGADTVYQVFAIIGQMDPEKLGQMTEADMMAIFQGLLSNLSTTDLNKALDEGVAQAAEANANAAAFIDGLQLDGVTGTGYGGAAIAMLSLNYRLPVVDGNAGGEGQLREAFRLTVPLPGNVDQQALIASLSSIISEHINRKIASGELTNADLHGLGRGDLAAMIRSALEADPAEDPFGVGENREVLQQMLTMLEDEAAFADEVEVEANPGLDAVRLTDFYNAAHRQSTAEIDGTIAKAERAMEERGLDSDEAFLGQMVAIDADADLKKAFIDRLHEYLNEERGLNVRYEDTERFYDDLVRMGNQMTGNGALGFTVVDVPWERLGTLSPTVVSGARQVVLEMEDRGGFGR